MPGEPRDTLGGCDLSSHLGPFLLEPTQLGDSVHHEDTPILEHLCPPNHMISLILFLVWKRVGGDGETDSCPAKFPGSSRGPGGLMIREVFYKPRSTKQILGF